MEWETVIGLEIHVQLSTNSKIFSGSSTAFGAAPNTQANEVDLALPGTLPVVNIEAIRKAALFGLAIDATIAKKSVFERKNYFYPDLPKGYQTTQLEHPIVGPGILTIDLGENEQREIRIHHAHLEEDAGKSMHGEIPGMTGVDLNRAGTVLIEIVSEPDMRSAKEAVAFLRKIHSIITYLGISDGDMSQGSMRCDANVSVRLKGEETLGTRTEIKNINSFRFVEKAINIEAERQIDVIEDGGSITQETRLYDADNNETRSMRSKEVANDYRYFPCPDLLPIILEDEFIEALREQLPELPDTKKQRFIDSFGLSVYDASILTAERAMADYFETVATLSGEAKLAANWVMGELMAGLNRDDISITQSPIDAKSLGQLISKINDGTLSSKMAKVVFEALWQKEGNVEQIIEAKGLKQESDTSKIETMIDDILANSEQQVNNYIQADPSKRPKMMGFFVGQAMKASQGKVNPKIVNSILMKKLNELT